MVLHSIQREETPSAASEKMDGSPRRGDRWFPVAGDALDPVGPLGRDCSVPKAEVVVKGRTGSFPSAPGEASIFTDSHDTEVVLDEQTAFAQQVPDSPVAEEVSMKEVEENSIQEADAFDAGKRSDLSPQANASPVPSCEGMPQFQKDMLEQDEAAQDDADSENEEQEQPSSDIQEDGQSAEQHEPCTADQADQSEHQSDGGMVLDEQTEFAQQVPDSPVAEEVPISEGEENSMQEADAFDAGKRSDLSPQANASPVPSCEGMPQSQNDMLEQDEAAQDDADSENEEQEQPSSDIQEFQEDDQSAEQHDAWTANLKEQSEQQSDGGMVLDEQTEFAQHAPVSPVAEAVSINEAEENSMQEADAFAAGAPSDLSPQANASPVPSCEGMPQFQNDMLEQDEAAHDDGDSEKEEQEQPSSDIQEFQEDDQSAEQHEPCTADQEEQSEHQSDDGMVLDEQTEFAQQVPDSPVAEEVPISEGEENSMQEADAFGAGAPSDLPPQANASPVPSCEGTPQSQNDMLEQDEAAQDDADSEKEEQEQPSSDIQEDDQPAEQHEPCTADQEEQSEHQSDGGMVLDEQTEFAQQVPDSHVAEEVSINEVEENSMQEADAFAAGAPSDLSPQSNASPVPSCEGMPKSQNDMLEPDEAARGDDAENEEKEQAWWFSFPLQNAELANIREDDPSDHDKLAETESMNDLEFSDQLDEQPVTNTDAPAEEHDAWTANLEEQSEHQSDGGMVLDEQTEFAQQVPDSHVAEEVSINEVEENSMQEADAFAAGAPSDLSPQSNASPVPSCEGMPKSQNDMLEPDEAARGDDAENEEKEQAWWFSFPLQNAELANIREDDPSDHDKLAEAEESMNVLELSDQLGDQPVTNTDAPAEEHDAWTSNLEEQSEHQSDGGMVLDEQTEFAQQVPDSPVAEEVSMKEAEENSIQEADALAAGAPSDLSPQSNASPVPFCEGMPKSQNDMLEPDESAQDDGDSENEEQEQPSSDIQEDDQSAEQHDGWTANLKEQSEQQSDGGMVLDEQTEFAQQVPDLPVAEEVSINEVEENSLQEADAIDALAAGAPSDLSPQANASPVPSREGMPQFQNDMLEPDEAAEDDGDSKNEEQEQPSSDIQEDDQSAEQHDAWTADQADQSEHQSDDGTVLYEQTEFAQQVPDSPVAEEVSINEVEENSLQAADAINALAAGAHSDLSPQLNSSPVPFCEGMPQSQNDMLEPDEAAQDDADLENEEQEQPSSDIQEDDQSAEQHDAWTPNLKEQSEQQSDGGMVLDEQTEFAQQVPDSPVAEEVSINEVEENSLQEAHALVDDGIFADLSPQSSVSPVPFCEDMQTFQDDLLAPDEAAQADGYYAGIEEEQFTSAIQEDDRSDHDKLSEKEESVNHDLELADQLDAWPVANADTPIAADQEDQSKQQSDGGMVLDEQTAFAQQVPDSHVAEEVSINEVEDHSIEEAAAFDDGARSDLSPQLPNASPVRSCKGMLQFQNDILEPDEPARGDDALENEEREQPSSDIQEVEWSKHDKLADLEEQSDGWTMPSSADEATVGFSALVFLSAAVID
eukprot:Skav227489  [mRNA]  locus=scaffold282:95537:102744:+ [translate_table: standard]